MTRYRSPERAKQLISFDNITLPGSFGTKPIYPTNHDFHIEYHNAAHIIGEYKLTGTGIEPGQRIALERLVNDIRDKPAVFFIAEHEIYDVDIPVDAAAATVVSFYYKRQWQHDKNQRVDEFINEFILRAVDFAEEVQEVIPL